ncbi:hypothetical protein [Sphingomonas sp.]|jgi:hypothetical protein|uniref:hypothetical protein n=1 Tax=Sphingomonas sp. TaxID=28214 RepID=UPI00263866D8|nr:hypothetical protein [Sphingomonas sp.]MDF2603506.1 hypothetical protein [Sphingomonas sp.]
MTEIISAQIGGLRGPGLTPADRQYLDDAATVAAQAESALAGFRSSFSAFGVSDPLNSTAGRSFLRADGAATSGNYKLTAAADGLTADFATAATTATNISVMASTDAVKLVPGKRSRITQSFVGTRLQGGFVRAGLAFGPAGARVNVNLRGDGTIYLTDDSFAQIGPNIVSARAQAVFGPNQVVTAAFEHDGQGGVSLTFTAPSGKSGPYPINVPLGDVWLSFTTNGTVKYLGPLLVEELPGLASDLYEQQKTVTQNAIQKSGDAFSASLLNGVSINLADPALGAFTVPNGVPVNSLAITPSAGGLAIASTSSGGRLVNIALPQVVARADRMLRVTLDWSKTRDATSSAFFLGLSFGAPGARRHYAMTDGGSIIVYDDAETAINGEATVVFAETQRSWGIGDADRIIFDNNGDGTAYARWFIGGKLVLAMRYTGVPLGQAYVNSRAVDVDVLVTSVQMEGEAKFQGAVARSLRPGAARRLSTALAPTAANAPTPGGGFTCTGADQLPSSWKLGTCWLVANHGQERVYSSTNPLIDVFAPSVLLIAPDRRTIIWERALPAGHKSAQGVCRGMVEGTFWVVDKDPKMPANSSIRSYNFDGSENVDARIRITDIMAAPDGWNLNGVALHPGVGTAGGLFINCGGIQRGYLIDIATKAILRTFTSFAAATDQLGYDQARDLLYFSYGPNGADGTVRFLRGLDGAFVGDVPLPGSRSIEGVKLIGGSNIVAWNDGAYHTEAQPPLSMSIEYEAVLPF